ncbi:hypothetical protein Y1Q_0000040 [Alligator mississippiensis]|uniref:Uncharacterized protein n=1 Tax=Alligator mississippiensis TaxID=8496 RepID=A0A151NTH3_ALLMI|nr:hypothetical protein Y1Q_0000040 [Alligator mississippiensis]
MKTFASCSALRSSHSHLEKKKGQVDRATGPSDEDLNPEGRQIQWVVHVVSDVTTGSIHHFLNQQIRVLVNREPALHQGYSQSGYYCELVRRPQDL